MDIIAMKTRERSLDLYKQARDIKIKGKIADMKIEDLPYRERKLTKKEKQDIFFSKMTDIA